MPNQQPEQLKSKTLAYIESMRLPCAPYGRYLYATGMTIPVLYASAYAAMTRHLYGDLQGLGERERREWIGYLQSHQDEDGLFRDPAIHNQQMYEGDPEWCGRRHLSCHVVAALSCLGVVAEKPQRWLGPFCEPGGIEGWLESRDWEEQPDLVGNEVLNVGALLQYARDFQGHPHAGDTVQRLLVWLSSHHLNPETGLWGGLDILDPLNLSRSVQAAYHFWPLYFHDHQPIPYLERAIDTLLRTQNPRGGFGWGVHNQDNPWNSSAWEDMDSIDPLVRMSTLTEYRREAIHVALSRALPWVLLNQNEDDGGFVFMRGVCFSYGHDLMISDADVSAMFSTWLRTQCLAVIAQVLPDSVVGAIPWQFCECPGMQFWRGGR